MEWLDTVGKVDLQRSLWFWAWTRFPDLVYRQLTGIDETRQVKVLLRDGRSFIGYPDARQSQQGHMVLVARDPTNPRRHELHSPFPIDEIAAVARE